MNEYETVFTIPRYGPHILAAALGIAGLLPRIIGVASFILTHHRFPKRIFWPVSLIIIGAFAMTFAVTGFRIKSDLLSRYDSEEWTVLEGTVHVLREQPYGDSSTRGRGSRNASGVTLGKMMMKTGMTMPLACILCGALLGCVALDRDILTTAQPWHGKLHQTDADGDVIQRTVWEHGRT